MALPETKPMWTLELSADGGWPPGPNDRLHWAARNRRTREWRQRVYAAAITARVPRLKRATVSVVFHTAKGRAMDADNATARCKAVYDGLTGCFPGNTFMPGILEDDDATHMVRGPVTEIRDGKRSIEIIVEAI